MKKSEKKVLPFPPPPRAPAPTTILCQIGNERFALTWQIEDLPPAAPLLRLKPPARKGKRIQSRGPSGDPSKEPPA